MSAPEGSIGVVRFDNNSCLHLASNEAHMLPCCINYSGPAPVSDYFKPKASDLVIEGVEVKEAAFRGRKLLGGTSKLPEGYSGLLLEKNVLTREGTRTAKKKDDGVSEVDVWNTKATFQDITYWRHDDNLHAVESGHKFFDWLRLASVIHKPISAEEVIMEQNAKMKGQKRKLEQP